MNKATKRQKLAKDLQAKLFYTHQTQREYASKKIIGKNNGPLFAPQTFALCMIP